MGLTLWSLFEIPGVILCIMLGTSQRGSSARGLPREPRTHGEAAPVEVPLPGPEESRKPEAALTPWSRQTAAGFPPNGSAVKASTMNTATRMAAATGQEREASRPPPCPGLKIPRAGAEARKSHRCVES